MQKGSVTQANKCIEYSVCLLQTQTINKLQQIEQIKKYTKIKICVEGLIILFWKLKWP